MRTPLNYKWQQLNLSLILYNKPSEAMALLLQQKFCCRLAEGPSGAELRLHPVFGLPALQVVGERPPLAHVLHEQHKVAPVLGAEQVLVHAQEGEGRHGVARGRAVQLQPRLPHNLPQSRGSWERGGTKN